jgi:hypothetical protein
MITYKIVKTETALGSENVLTKTNGELVSFVPMDETNSDYQAYLKWKSEQL